MYSEFMFVVCLWSGVNLQCYTTRCFKFKFPKEEHEKTVIIRQIFFWFDLTTIPII